MDKGPESFGRQVAKAEKDDLFEVIEFREGFRECLVLAGDVLDVKEGEKWKNEDEVSQGVGEVNEVFLERGAGPGVVLRSGCDSVLFPLPGEVLVGDEGGESEEGDYHGDGKPEDHLQDMDVFRGEE